MTKEEILEKSRNENKNHDIYDLEIQNKAARFSIYATSILICLLIIVEILVNKFVPFELIMIICGMQSVLFFTKFAKMHKKHELCVALIYTIGFILSAGLYIKGLFFPNSTTFSILSFNASATCSTVIDFKSV